MYSWNTEFWEVGKQLQGGNSWEWDCIQVRRLKAKETLYMLALKPCEVEGGTEKNSDSSSPPYSPGANTFFQLGMDT